MLPWKLCQRLSNTSESPEFRSQTSAVKARSTPSTSKPFQNQSKRLHWTAGKHRQHSHQMRPSLCQRRCLPELLIIHSRSPSSLADQDRLSASQCQGRTPCRSVPSDGLFSDDHSAQCYTGASLLSALASHLFKSECESS